MKWKSLTALAAAATLSSLGIAAEEPGPVSLYVDAQGNVVARNIS